MKYTALFALIISLLILGSVNFSQQSIAQEITSSGTGLSLSIVGDDALDGQIVASSPEGYVITGIPYDSNLYGVVTDTPAISMEDIDDPTTRLVTRTGTTYVLVSNANGEIKKNDFITSSRTPGVGQRADRNGMILGIAQENFNSSGSNDAGKILVAINPHYNASFLDSRLNLLELLRTAADPSTLTPLTSLRYLMAAGIVLISFGFGFIYFGRVAGNGVEALGRNPLASRTIQLSLLFNLGLMIAIMLIGLTIGYFILTL